MHVKGFLHKLLSSVMHKKRLNTLILLVISLLKAKKLSLTQLGREIDLPIQERSCIKRADRFIGNKKIEKEALYFTLIRTLIGSQIRPWIIIDWSEVPNCTHHILRAALVTSGRALTLYEQVHSENYLYNTNIEKTFLRRLKSFLPNGCRPIIVTDAGFHNAWFREAVNLGFDYVGRVRFNKHYSLDQGKTWRSYRKLFSIATFIPKFIGKVMLCHKQALETYLYVFRDKAKGRKSLNCYGEKRRNALTLRYQETARDPWVLASSLSGRGMAKKIVKMYKKRMQIEEGFRDLKSSRYGFSFEHTQSKQLLRIHNMLLIAALASFIAWLIGWAIEKSGMHRHFQVNTIKHRRTLSLFYLGCRAIKRRIKIPIDLIEIVKNEDWTYV